MNLKELLLYIVKQIKRKTFERLKNVFLKLHIQSYHKIGWCYRKIPIAIY